jgi:hypothetical protein
MTRLYAVYERSAQSRKKGRATTTLEDSYVLVKEGFCWPGLFFGPLWALAAGMWVIFLLLVALGAAIFLLPEAFGGSDSAEAWACGALLVLLGMFGNDLRQWSLARSGYALVSVVSGADLVDAERRLFTSMNSLYG